MTATLRAVTLREVESIWVPRFNTESARELLPHRQSVGAIEAAHKDGAILLVEDADVRTVVMGHKEAADGVTVAWINFLLRVSTRELEVFLGTTRWLLSQGYTSAQFDPRGVTAVNATAATGATRDPRGHNRVPLLQAQTELLARGAT